MKSTNQEIENEKPSNDYLQLYISKRIALDKKKNPFIASVRYDKEDQIKNAVDKILTNYTLDEQKKIFNKKDDDGNTAIMYTFQRSDGKNIAVYLLDYPIDVNNVYDNNGNSYFMQTVKFCYNKVIAAIFDQELVPPYEQLASYYNKLGQSIFTIAATATNPETTELIFKKLSKRGDNIDYTQVDKNNNTMIKAALSKQQMFLEEQEKIKKCHSSYEENIPSYNKVVFNIQKIIKSLIDVVFINITKTESTLASNNVEYLLSLELEQLLSLQGSKQYLPFGDKEQHNKYINLYKEIDFKHKEAIVCGYLGNKVSVKNITDLIAQFLLSVNYHFFEKQDFDFELIGNSNSEDNVDIN